MPRRQRFIAYYRVSTRKQGRSGLGLEAQRAAVAAYVNGGSLLAEYTEVESGLSGDNYFFRPRLSFLPVSVLLNDPP